MNLIQLATRKVVNIISNWDAESLTLRKVDRKYMERFEMWCWRRMEKISWTDRMGNEVLRTVKGERNIL
jgi:hypothetical protein